MSLYIPQMTDTPGVTIPGLAGNFGDLEGSQVEYGSNENGKYWRWESGLQICRHFAQIYGSTDDAEFAVSWDFPALFRMSSGYRKQPQDVFISATVARSVLDSSGIVSANLYSGYTVSPGSFINDDYTVFTLRLRNGEPRAHFSSERFVYMMMFAIGRWK